jgi:hypothetical protein
MGRGTAAEKSERVIEDWPCLKGRRHWMRGIVNVIASGYDGERLWRFSGLARPVFPPAKPSDRLRLSSSLSSRVGGKATARYVVLMTRVVRRV